MFASRERICAGATLCE